MDKERAEYLAALQEAIRATHGCDSNHQHTVPVHEKHNGTTVWEGEVEIFEVNHPKAKRCFAWGVPSDVPGKKYRVTTVLSVAPVRSALAAVRAAVVAEYRAKK